MEQDEYLLARDKHELFRKKYGVTGQRLEWGMDFLKAMPYGWTNAQRLECMLELHDNLLNKLLMLSEDS